MARILFVSGVPTDPCIAGNRQRLVGLIRAAELAGHDVRLLWLEQESGDPDGMHGRLGDRFVHCPVPCVQRPWGHLLRLRHWLRRKIGLGKPPAMDVDCFRSEALARHVRAEGERIEPDVVVVVYVVWSWLLELFSPRVRKLIDTQDVLSNRHERFKGVSVATEWYSISERAERRGLRRADCVLAIHASEAEFFKALAGRPVVTVGQSFPLNPLSLDPEAGEDFLFVGSDNGVNRDGLAWLLGEIWPEVRRRLPDARLGVVGRVCRHVGLVPEGVTVHGVVPDMADAYRRAAVVLAPLRFGTGLKIKSVEALSYGRPLICSPVAAEGMEDSGRRAWVCAADTRSFVEGCVRLSGDARERERLVRAGLECVAEWNEISRSRFLDALAGRW